MASVAMSLIRGSFRGSEIQHCGCQEDRRAAVSSPNLNRIKSNCQKNVGTWQVSARKIVSRVRPAEEVAEVTTYTPERPLRPVENMKGTSMEEEEAAIMPTRLDGKRITCGDPKCKVGPHPPVKNMMFVETIESILSYEKPARRDPKKNDVIAAFQQQIRKEVEEKGYVEVPDKYEEEAEEMMLEGYKRAYRKVFGTDSPPELLMHARLSISA